jgi:hypothetical protein
MIGVKKGATILHKHALEVHKLITPWVTMVNHKNEPLMKGGFAAWKKFKEGLSQQDTIEESIQLKADMEFIEQIAYDQFLQEWITQPIVILDPHKAPSNAPGIFQNGNYQGQYTLTSGDYLKEHFLRAELVNFYSEIQQYRDEITESESVSIDEIVLWMNEKDIPNPAMFTPDIDLDAAPIEANMQGDINVLLRNASLSNVLSRYWRYDDLPQNVPLLRVLCRNIGERVNEPLCILAIFTFCSFLVMLMIDMLTTKTGEPDFRFALRWAFLSGLLLTLNWYYGSTIRQTIGQYSTSTVFFMRRNTRDRDIEDAQPIMHIFEDNGASDVALRSLHIHSSAI